MCACLECSVIAVMPALVAGVHSQGWAGGERGRDLCMYVCVCFGKKADGTRMKADDS